MDGNGRWAQQQGMDRIFGHQNGVQSVKETVETCAELGVEYLTLYAFSTENWQRPKEEVSALMDLLVSTINAETPVLQKNNIRLAAIGDIDSLRPNTKAELEKAIAETAHNTRLTLILALSYSSRWEITNSLQIICKKVQEGKLNPENITSDLISQHLTTAAFPDPELLIRTSGEYRISNFLLWQIAYAELYFTPKLWPEFRKNDLYEAIIDFQSRERRFGKTSEQINP
jgi:undecaprenyl diphosphate synthase